MDSPTDDQIDHTLNEEGPPAPQAAQNSLPGEQATSFVGDPDFPLESTISTKLRALGRDNNRTIHGRDGR